jgi:hypothetical protein
MLALPADTAVTTPPDTVAIAVLLLLHVTFLFVALAGATVAVSVSVLPTVMLVVVLFKVMPVTGTLAAVTVTVQVAVLLPSAVVTVMVALPADTAVTTPLNDTIATALLLLLHDTFLLVAFAGLTVAINVSVPPTVKLKEVLLKVTLVTETGVTVTAQTAVLFPSAVVTVMFALPTATAVTTPLDDTVATAGALLLHDTF